MSKQSINSQLEVKATPVKLSAGEALRFKTSSQKALARNALLADKNPNISMRFLEVLWEEGRREEFKQILLNTQNESVGLHALRIIHGQKGFEDLLKLTALNSSSERVALEALRILSSDLLPYNRKSGSRTALQWARVIDVYKDASLLPVKEAAEKVVSSSRKEDFELLVNNFLLSSACSLHGVSNDVNLLSPSVMLRQMRWAHTLKDFDRTLRDAADLAFTAEPALFKEMVRFLVENEGQAQLSDLFSKFAECPSADPLAPLSAKKASSILSALVSNGDWGTVEKAVSAHPCLKQVSFLYQACDAALSKKKHDVFWRMLKKCKSPEAAKDIPKLIESRHAWKASFTVFGDPTLDCDAVAIPFLSSSMGYGALQAVLYYGENCSSEEQALYAFKLLTAKGNTKLAFQLARKSRFLKVKSAAVAEAREVGDAELLKQLLLGFEPPSKVDSSNMALAIAYNDLAKDLLEAFFELNKGDELVKAVLLMDDKHSMVLLDQMHSLGYVDWLYSIALSSEVELAAHVMALDKSSPSYEKDSAEAIAWINKAVIVVSVLQRNRESEYLERLLANCKTPSLENIVVKALKELEELLPRNEIIREIRKKDFLIKMAKERLRESKQELVRGKQSAQKFVEIGEKKIAQYSAERESLVRMLKLHYNEDY